MHYLVGMIVKAESAEEALEVAEQDADTLVEQGYYDYHSFEGRWGESEALPLGSEKAQQIIKELMEADRADFDRGIEAVRYMIENYTDDQIYNETFSKEDKENTSFYLSRYQFGVLYNNNSGGGVFALDGDLWGSKLDKDADLKYILDKGTDDLWLVTADFHN